MESFSKNKKLKSMLLILIWGIILFGILVFVGTMIGNDMPNNIMPCRVQMLDECITAFNNGGIPEFENNIDHAIGLYMFGGKLGSILLLSAQATMELMSYIFSFMVLTITPILIFLIIGKIRPVLVFQTIIPLIMGEFLFFAKCDVYVSIGIAFVLLSLPLLWILLYREDIISHTIAICLLIMVMSISNIARQHTSLSLLIVLTIILMNDFIRGIKEKNLKQIIKILLLLIVTFCTYDLFATSIPQMIIRINGGTPWLNVSTAWHNIFIGFGYFDNPFGIEYLDENMYARVNQIYPEVSFGTEEYFKLCKTLTISFVLEHPIFCIWTEIKKTIFTIILVFGKLFIGKIGAIRGGLLIIYIFSIIKLKLRFYCVCMYKEFLNYKYFIIILFVYYLVGIAFSIVTAPVIFYSITSYAVISMLLIWILYRLFCLIRSKH